MATNPEDIHIPPRIRQLVAMRVEQQGQSQDEVFDELMRVLEQSKPKPLGMILLEWIRSLLGAKHKHGFSHETPTNTDWSGKSFYDVANDAGLVGCFVGPSDLSTNKTYFDDFGEN